LAGEFATPVAWSALCSQSQSTGQRMWGGVTAPHSSWHLFDTGVPGYREPQ